MFTIFILSLLPFAISTSLTRRSAETCPSDSPVSCSSSSSEDTCCYETPGGLILQVQFWDTNPSEGPSDSWTIHGLWPDNCDGSYSESCDPSRDYNDISTLLQNAGQTDTLSYMQTYWISNDESSEAFWEHEWSTHGTCYSTLDPSCYTNYQTGDEAVDFFVRVVSLFQSLPTYQWLEDAGIVPSNDNTYTLDQLNQAVENQWGATPVFLCKKGVLDSVEYYFNLQGNIPNGNFIPTQASDTSSCPSTGISYPPKN